MGRPVSSGSFLGPSACTRIRTRRRFRSRTIWLHGLERLDVKRPWTRRNAYLEQGLPEPLAARLAGARWADLYDELAPTTPVCARRLAAALEKRLARHWRATRTQVLPQAARIAPLVRAIETGQVRPEAFEFVFDELLVAPLEDVEAVVARFAKGPEDEAELEARIAGLARLKPVAKNGADALLRSLMGRVMPEFRGRLDPQVVQARIVAALGAESGGAQ